jgi:hypothetical protein
MKKRILIILLIILILPLAGCGAKKDKGDALKFKESYESLNKTKREDGELYRTISIDENNPIVYTTYEEVQEKISNNENFIVYFGSSKSEWSRSVVPYLLEQAKIQGIDVIYYVDLTPQEDDEAVKGITLEDQYYQDVTRAIDVPELNDSMLAVFINGEMQGKTSGNSEKQTDASMDITGEMIQDMKETFKQIYIIYNSNRK